MNYKRTIHMSDTDAAGVVFFARYYDIMHESYEYFLIENNISIQQILMKEDYILPIARSEAQYLAPLFIGDDIIVELKLKELHTNAFELEYHIKKKTKLVAMGSTSHVCLDKVTRKRKLLADALKLALEKL